MCLCIDPYHVRSTPVTAERRNLVQSLGGCFKVDSLGMWGTPFNFRGSEGSALEVFWRKINWPNQKILTQPPMRKKKSWIGAYCWAFISFGYGIIALSYPTRVTDKSPHWSSLISDGGSFIGHVCRCFSWADVIFPGFSPYLFFPCSNILIQAWEKLKPDKTTKNQADQLVISDSIRPRPMAIALPSNHTLTCQWLNY